ncbi:MAG: pilus assembly protein [Hyphomicrobiaceae bacterium]|nr:pilus assembly protein [Hyphomicrobiaceae bacterium]
MKQLRIRLKTLTDYARDTSGVAAIEFALILPILFALFLGTVEYARATMYARRMGQVTAMVSDLVAREFQITDAAFQGIKAGADTAWGSFDNIDTLKFHIKHVRRAGDLATKVSPGSAYVEWDYSIRGAPTVPQCSPYTLPSPDMIAKGTSVVVVTSTYTYQTLLGVAAPGMTSSSLNWSTESNHAPRDFCVDYLGNKCISKCE